MPAVIESPATAREMLHPEVLKVFGAEPVRDVACPYEAIRSFGSVDIRFPDMYQAAAWVKVWGAESGDDPPVYLQLTAGLRGAGRKLTTPVRVTVTDPEGG